MVAFFQFRGQKIGTDRNGTANADHNGHGPTNGPNATKTTLTVGAHFRVGRTRDIGQSPQVVMSIPSSQKSQAGLALRKVS